jgi:hypothetical protein
MRGPASSSRLSQKEPPTVRSSVRRSFPAALILSLGLLAGANGAAVAATTNANVFVVPSGGSGSCVRQATPVAFASAPSNAKCSSVQAAVAAMSGGDTAIVKSGTYANASVSGVSKSPSVRVVVEPGGTATLNGGGSYSAMSGVILDGTEGATGQGWDTTDGFSIGSNGGGAAQNLRIDGALIHNAGGGQTIWMVGCNNVTIAHTEIRDVSNADGIQMAKYTGQSECTNVVFDGIYMHDFTADCGVDHQDGIQIRAGSNITFTNGRIFRLNNCGSQGFFANQEGDLGGSNTTLSNTIIAGVNGNAINFSSKPPQKMINNTIDGGLNTCQPVSSTCTGVVAKNNIFNSPCAGQAILHNRVQNSADWANNVSTSNCGYSSQGDTVTSNFNAMFTSPGSPSYDYRLKSGAFAVGKASKTDFTTTDFEGDTRDSAPDAGADEQGSGGTPPPPPPPVDTTAPDTTISSGTSGSSTSTTASFSFTGSDDITAAGSLTFACSIDGGSYASCTSPKSYTSLTVGDHTFSVRATDAAGNADASPATGSWTVTAPPPPPVDTIAPDTTIGSGPADSTATTTASFAFTGSDDTTAVGSLTFECALDGAVFSSCTSPRSYTSLAVGDHTFSVRAKDAAGNVDASPATDTWTVTAPAPVDTTAPDTTIDSGPSGSTTATSASIAFSGADNVTAAGSLTFQCKLDGGSYRTCTSPKSYTGLALGSHTVSVRARDAAGNTDASPAIATWTVVAQPPADTTAPTTTVTSAPADGTTNTTASFSFTGTDNATAADALTFQCSLDNVAYATCASPKSYTDLTVGTHNVRIRARDEAGNVDGSATSVTWTIAAPDTTAPETTITSAPEALTLSSDAQFAFTAQDDKTAAADLTFQCRLDGAAWATCTSPASYTGLALLGHTFDVRAIDAAGNVDASPATASWTVLAPALPDPVVDLPVIPDAPDAPDVPDPVVDVPSDPVVVPVATRVMLGTPTAGTMFSQSLTASAVAVPAPGATIKRVEFWLDGARIARDTSAPYKTTWSAPRRLTTGLHTLSARAFDSRGAVVSTAVTVVHTAGGTAASKAKASRLSASASMAQLSTAPAADGGTDLLGAARSAGAVTVTLASCSGTTATKAMKMKLMTVGMQLSGHWRAGRLCVVGLLPTPTAS